MGFWAFPDKRSLNLALSWLGVQNGRPTSHSERGSQMAFVQVKRPKTAQRTNTDSVSQCFSCFSPRLLTNQLKRYMKWHTDQRNIGAKPKHMKRVSMLMKTSSSLYKIGILSWSLFPSHDHVHLLLLLLFGLHSTHINATILRVWFLFSFIVFIYQCSGVLGWRMLVWHVLG